MKDIINFCKSTNHDYMVVGLPNGSLRATIDCENPFDAMKIKEMARSRGFAIDTTQVVIIFASDWTDPLVDIINFCVDINCDYLAEFLNGSLRATIDCENPFDAMKIKEMARSRGFAIDTTQVVIIDSNWTNLLDDMGF